MDEITSRENSTPQRFILRCEVSIFHEEPAHEARKNHRERLLVRVALQVPDFLMYEDVPRAHTALEI